jgi:hypothetical protein
VKSPAYIRAAVDLATLPRPDIAQCLWDELIADGMVSTTEANRAGSSPRCKAYVDMLAAVPLPVKRWVDPRGAPDA